MVNVKSKVFEGSDVGYCRLIGQRGQTQRRISSQGAPVARGAGQPCLEVEACLASPASEHELAPCPIHSHH